MVDIKEFIESINLSGGVLTRDDIYNLFLMLQKYFKDSARGLIFTHKPTYPLFYDLESKHVWLNYDLLIKTYSHYVDAIDSSLNRNVLINYYILFAFIHEFVHGIQHDGKASSNEDVNRLYQFCFSFVHDGDIRLKRVLNNVIYQKLHDYFATEINANIVAYEYLLTLINADYRDHFMRELYELIMKCYYDYNLYDMYQELLGIDNVQNLRFSLPFEEKIRYGVFLEKEERKGFLDKKEIQLAKVINCKWF